MDQDQKSDQLAPGFLVAPPSMVDGNFRQTLVLLAVHDDDGSMGFIINRPSDIQLSQLLKELDIETSVSDRPVLFGGPVANYSGFVLYEHPAGQPLAPGLGVTETISVSPSRQVLESAAAGALPGRFELLLGYSGWGTDQLDDEICMGGWLHSHFDNELLFDVDVELRWQEAYARIGVNPFAFIDVPGGAQA